MSKVQQELIRDYANAAAQSVAQRAMATLKGSRHTLSGEDSGLGNTWAEICVQVIGGESFFWEAYEAAMRDAVLQHLAELPKRDRVSMWLCTEAGWDWHWDIEHGLADGPPMNSEAIEDAPVDEEETVKWIVSQHLLPLAEGDDSPEVASCLSGDDEWDDRDEAELRTSEDDESPPA